MFEHNNHKYSTKSFDEYEFRALVRLKRPDENYTGLVSIYTTNTDKDEVLEVIRGRLKKGTKLIELENWSSQQVDKNIAELIDEVDLELELSKDFKVGEKYKSNRNTLAVNCEYEILKKNNMSCNVRLWEDGSPTSTVFKNVSYSALKKIKHSL